MIPKAALVLVAIFSWLATAVITFTVLTYGPITSQSSEEGALVLVASDDLGDTSANDALPRLGVIPVFSLTNQHNESFGLNDLRGKVWIVNTIFTRCNAICPTLTGGMKQIQSTLDRQPETAEHVRLVSISIDGEHDTPQILRSYAQAFNADPQRWLFLTGAQSDVWPLVQDGLKLPVEEGKPGDEMDILHSGKLLLIDRTGVIRGYYDGLSQGGRIELLVDLRKLLDEE